jgi:hypothetical protein
MYRGGVVKVNGNVYGNLTNNISYHSLGGNSSSTMPSIYDTQAEIIKNYLNTLNVPCGNGRMDNDDFGEDSHIKLESSQADYNPFADEGEDEDEDEDERIVTNRYSKEFSMEPTSSSSTQRIPSMKRKVSERSIADTSSIQLSKKRQLSEKTTKKVTIMETAKRPTRVKNKL